MVKGKNESVDTYPIIANFFRKQLEHTSLSVDSIAEGIAQAAQLCAEAILAEKKLFSTGLASDCSSAVALAGLLQRGILRERPSLPVVELAEHHIDSVDTGTLWASQQIQALGQAGDVAIIFALALSESDIQRLHLSAEDRQVTAIWVGQRGPGLSISSGDETIESRLTLNYSIAICLARLIETYTFGPVED